MSILIRLGMVLGRIILGFVIGLIFVLLLHVIGGLGE